MTNSRASRILAKMLACGTAIDLVIASGVVTITRTTSYFTIDTESSASTDDLNTINGGQTGDTIIIRAKSSVRDVTFKDDADNIHIGSDFTMLTTADNIMLTYTGGVWQQVSRSTN